MPGKKNLTILIVLATLTGCESVDHKPFEEFEATAILLNEGVNQFATEYSQPVGTKILNDIDIYTEVSTPDKIPEQHKDKKNTLGFPPPPDFGQYKWYARHRVISCRENNKGCSDKYGEIPDSRQPTYIRPKDFVAKVSILLTANQQYATALKLASQATLTDTDLNQINDLSKKVENKWLEYELKYDSNVTEQTGENIGLVSAAFTPLFKTTITKRQSHKLASAVRLYQERINETSDAIVKATKMIMVQREQAYSVEFNKKYNEIVRALKPTDPSEKKSTLSKEEFNKKYNQAFASLNEDYINDMNTLASLINAAKSLKVSHEQLAHHLDKNDVSMDSINSFVTNTRVFLNDAESRSRKNKERIFTHQYQHFDEHLEQLLVTANQAAHNHALANMQLTEINVEYTSAELKVLEAERTKTGNIKALRKNAEELKKQKQDAQTLVTRLLKESEDAMKNYLEYEKSLKQLKDSIPALYTTRTAKTDSQK